MVAMKTFYNILGILYQVIFAKDSFIKFKLKKTKHKKYIFLHLNCLCDSSCNSIHVQLSNSYSLILTTRCLHALFAFSCSVDTIKSCELHLQFYLCFHL